MYFIFQIISLFSVFLFVWSYVIIGNYSQLNPKDCGISRVSTLVDTNCFEWHKGYGSPLKRGKIVGHSDAPWMAHLTSYEKGSSCTGSVIADQWIITAAHCLNGSTRIHIYVGYNKTNNGPNYESKKLFIHPKFVNDPLENIIYDLGLIKMNKSINTSAGEHSICLPNKYQSPGPGIFKHIYEYAMIAGWGTNSQESEIKLRIAEARLQILILENYKPNTLKVFTEDNQGICHGDSGSPVFQYSMGRAVIVALEKSSFIIDNTTGCERDGNSSSSRATWVDSEMDWIENVILSN